MTLSSVARLPGGTTRAGRFALAGGLAPTLHWLTMVALVAADFDAPLVTAWGAIAGSAVNYFLQRAHAFGSQILHHRAVPATHSPVC